MHLEDTTEKLRVGWREWVALPGLGIPGIKAKIDTGARTSALHTFRLDTFSAGGGMRVRFGIHPLPRRTDLEIFCEADVVDRRLVTDSGGHREWRYVILTPLRLGGAEWEIEITLTNRDSMLFRMLLGRSALTGRLMVDPEAFCVTGRRERQVLLKMLKSGKNP
jgi:hypothetical protein